MEDSLLRDFTVRLDKEEVQLMKELDSVQEKISKLDPEQVHKQMLEALQQEAINSIAVALDISDVLEDRPESNSIFHKDVSLLKSNKKELDERKKATYVQDLRVVTLWLALKE